ncbi:MAG: prephenate dehydratase [bacterium (Candidatus Ratteibacteria) CG15_BIG_FIL_POST_REV_8_21_14_020_41_12]|uniref:Bifunctional chorismate mutase/prephenate dehydratase n=1 Tax=bacterium (Candidatus Ratteibacteria) CG15_BIG_FIL_POST_REV_8_21_14_020_41_12 TaxID=2014291 RepID=A0A2M7GZN5_9BACT|nr:MAG: prephenate dehydratase [bacterium (Candidatus Ratteibacteria) CG15_BIG_FIL_POST_REV_8_21_14_020_41_12]
MKNLEELRKKIDVLDLKLVHLLNERAKKVLEIARIKQKKGENSYDPAREKKILERLLKENRGPLSNAFLVEIIKELLNNFRNLQKREKIVYLGPPATFTHLAVLNVFGKRANLVPAKSITEVFIVVEKGQATFGVVPIENSTEGIVSHTLDMFLDFDLKVSAEVMLKVSHHLLSKGSLKKIRKVYSHSQAIAQCRHWLEENLPTARLIEVESTAKAAELAAKEAGTAAIASDVAASLYHLKIVANHIEDSLHNFTRFLVIGTEFARRSGQDKTSILFSIKDRVGALYDMLTPFRKYGINLTKIESRPTKRKAWEYVFFVDFLGYKDDEKVRKALSELEKDCLFLKIFGSYPVGD